MPMLSGAARSSRTMGSVALVHAIEEVALVTVIFCYFSRACDLQWEHLRHRMLMRSLHMKVTGPLVTISSVNFGFSSPRIAEHVCQDAARGADSLLMFCYCFCCTETINVDG
jgi:hypothetical protein